MFSMNRILSAALLAAAAQSAMATDVGVSIGIGDPNFYGRIDIGNFPRPVLMYPKPMIIAPAPYAAAPLYLRVPPGHARDWRRYCGRYDACGVPVYFVQDGWYRNVYAPRYRADYDHHDRYHDRRDDRREERFDDRRDRRDDRYDDRHDRRQDRREDRRAERFEERGGPWNGHGHGRGRD